MGSDVSIQEKSLETQQSCLEMIIGKSKPQIDIGEQHDMARLVMADLEDIFYSAVVRALSDVFSER